MARELANKEHVRPGHLDLHLNAASVHGQYQISRNIAIMDKILRDFRCNNCRFNKDPFDRCNTCKYVVTCNAILNLKGAFLYYQKQYLKACNEFKKVLEIEKENQNALCNLHHVYMKLGDWEKADKYYKRYNGFSDDNNKKATYLGEQGFAILFDCHTKINELERYRRAAKMFEECLQISKDLLKKKEEDSELELAVLQWKLWYAQYLQRMSNTCSNPSDDFNHCYEEGTITLKHVIGAKIAEKHSHITSIAYTYLGIFQSKKKKDDQCFVKALEIQRNTEALIRYAICLKSDNVCKAIEHIKEAIEMDESADGNWFAWSVSSDLHVCHVEKYKSSEDRELLDVAIKHGDKASSENQTTNLFVTLGKAYHYKARDHTCDEEKRHELYLKALENFLHALQHLDGDKHDSVHVAHGNCLFDMGQYHPALESFKRAVELGLDGRKNILSNYFSMMKCYMMKLAKEKDVKEKQIVLETILYWLHVGDRNETLLKQTNPEKKNPSISSKNKSQQKDGRQRSISLTPVYDFHSNGERGDNVDSARTVIDHAGIPDEDEFFLDKKHEANFNVKIDQEGYFNSLNINQAIHVNHHTRKVCVNSKVDVCSRKLRRERSKSESCIDNLSDKKKTSDIITSETIDCNYEDIITSETIDCNYADTNTEIVLLNHKTAVREKCPHTEKLVSVADKDTLDNDCMQRKECLYKHQRVDKNTCSENGKEKRSDWQTISPEALISVIKFILQKNEEKQDKLIRWCLYSETLNDLPQDVLDILLHLVSFRKTTLIEDCLKHLNDQSYLSFFTRNRGIMDKTNQSTYHMDELLRSWYVSEISNCLVEIQCKRCQSSKLWKEDCGHGLNPVTLYSAIAKYCPSFAKDIADHMMTLNVKLAQRLLEVFQKGYISYANDDINEEIIEQHVMACISDLHYQACWLRADMRSLCYELRHDKSYRKGLHPQHHRTLNRCLSLKEDSKIAFNQLVRLSTFDEDSHMKLVKWQDKRDTIYLNYCRAESKSASPSKIPVSERPPKRRFPKYKYDFFVINSDKDNDWVRFELLPTLEGRYGFKGCFTKRDYMPGETIFNEFGEKVKESSKVLLVLTENFKKDELCCFQMQSALRQKLCTDKGKLIPLVTVSGDDTFIRKKVIPEEIQHIVCFSVNRFDWEKLVRAIEEE